MAIPTAVLLFALLAGAVAAPTRSLLQGATTPPAGFEVVSPAPPTKLITFHIALKQRNLAALTSLFEEISDPSNVKYGQYMTHAEIVAIVAPSAEDVAKALVAFPFCTSLGDSLKCVASVAAIEAIFQTKMFTVRHLASSLTLTRALGSVSVPADLADLIEFVTPLNQYALPSLHKHAIGASDFVIVPETLTSMYNITEAGDARSSQGVVEFGEEQWAWLQTDLTKFTTETDTTIAFTKSYGPPVQPSDPIGLEASLDVQYIGAIGQGNTNWYWKESTWQYDFTQNLQAATDRPAVLSLSYAWSEQEQCVSITDEIECNKLKLNNTAYVNRVNTEFMKIGLLGVTITAASGDSGCHGRTDETCSGAAGKAMFPDYPAASPYVTSVGGTALTKPVSNSPTEPICKKLTCATGGTEVTATTAGNVAAISSGGGFSTIAVQPSYQSTVVNLYLKNAGSGLPPAQYFDAGNRGFPDVSALAHNFYVEYEGSPTMVDGTSCAAPSWGGIIGLLNAHRLRLGRPVVGFANPLLYQIYAATSGAAFNDITVGDNACTESGCACKYGFPAIRGWDAATGLGTPNVGLIIAAMDALDEKREQLLKHASATA